MILLSFWLFWGIVYISDANRHTPQQDAEVLDSPLWAINFCTLKIHSGKKTQNQKPSYVHFKW